MNTELRKAEKVVMSENNKIGEREASVRVLVSNGYDDQILRIMLGLADRD